jgi:alkylhydroperoxidase family enzyme
VAHGSAGDLGARPEPAGRLVDKVARDAYKITDEDVAAATGAGLDEEVVFELICAAALGAGVGRRTIGLEAIDAWEARAR